MKKVFAELDRLVKARQLTVQIGNKRAQLYEVPTDV